MRRIPEIEDIVLEPGRYFIGGAACRMQTILGSGVAITLWHRARQTGAMAHFLPAPEADGIALTLDGNSGSDGLQRVLQALQWSQINPVDCVARICGGDLLMSPTDRVPSLNTGHAKGELARRLLRACGVPIVAEAFYAMGQHRLTFDLSTGRIHSRRIKPAVVGTEAPTKSPAGSRAPAASSHMERHARAH